MSKTFRNLLEVPIFWLTLVISHNTGFVDYKQLDFSDMHCKTEQSVATTRYSTSWLCCWRKYRPSGICGSKNLLLLPLPCLIILLPWRYHYLIRKKMPLIVSKAHAFTWHSIRSHTYTLLRLKAGLIIGITTTTAVCYVFCRIWKCRRRGSKCNSTYCCQHIKDFYFYYIPVFN